ALYGQALLMAQRPLRPADNALLNRTFLGLLEWSTGHGADGETGHGADGETGHGADGGTGA
ncbi:hypothetical protein, partial [Streptomyces sp. NPDC050600]|uniref:hypothetical protein n=1 Tax=Streptomyces sp. NPDC050600 TaxID=3157213 RepID=UPI003431CE0B